MNDNIKFNLDELECVNLKNKRIDIFFEDMGYGIYQIRLFFMLLLILFTDSCQMLLINLILKNLKNEMDISSTEKSCLQSSVFMGLSIGSLISAKYIDIYGRKQFIIYGGVILLIFSIISAFSLNCVQLIIFRIILGIGMGIQMASGISLASESIPKNNRSLYLTAVWVGFPLGEIFCSISAWILMPNFEEGQWRKLIILCTIPMIGTLFYSNQALESARYYYSNNYFDEGKNVIQKIEEINLCEVYNNDLMIKLYKFFINSFSFLNFSENKDTNKEEVIKYSKLSEDDFKIIEEESKNNVLNKYNSEWKELFNPRFIGITLRTWFLWISGTTIHYQIIFMLPQLLLFENDINQNKNKDETKHTSNNDYYIGLIIAAIIAFPKSFIAGILSEYFGRLKAMKICAFFTIILILVLLLTNSNIALICGLMKIFAGSIGSINKVYSSEIFPTKLRVLGSSSGFSIGRFSTVLISFISQLLISWLGFLKAPFIFSIILCIIALYCLSTLEIETKNKHLDHLDKKDFNSEYNTIS